MIVNRSEGRLRVRHPALGDPETARACAQAASSAGASSAVANIRTAGLLIRYDPGKIAAETIIRRLEKLLGRSSPPPPPSRTRAAALAGDSMSATSLALGTASLASALFGSKKLHAAVSLAFFGLGFAHALSRRGRRQR